MTLSKFKSISVYIVTILFVILFYKNMFGLNLLVFESLVFGMAVNIHKPNFRSSLFRILVFGTLVSLLAVVVNNSSISKFVNIVSFIAVLGGVTFSEYKLLSSFIKQAIANISVGSQKFISNNEQGGRSRRTITFLKSVLIPLAIIVVFILIYYNSNNHFARIMTSMIHLFPRMNFIMLIYLLIGFVIAVSAFFGVRNNRLVEREMSLNAGLVRVRKHKAVIRIMGLKDEYRSGVFLLVILNLLLLVFNYADISTIWFSYQWNGEFLKGFVHAGTYLLIVSLLLSIGIVLYYFRGNLNFYAKNKFLLGLTYLWMAQNFILVISLFIRNAIYIEHFALAYKRIGVYAFLLAVCIGIVSIVVKVRDKRSLFYIIKVNTISSYLILVALTTINWDGYIAKYNIGAYERSFVEMEFLLTLSDKALPYLDMGDEALKKMKVQQNGRYSFSQSYITHQSFKEYLENKMVRFKGTYPARSIWEWNYADYKAYQMLIKD